MVRVLICDDQTVVREGLAAILSTDDEIEVVGLARNGEEALALAATDRPDVVLMDLNMPVMNGMQATQRLRTPAPRRARPGSDHLRRRCMGHGCDPRRRGGVSAERHAAG